MQTLLLQVICCKDTVGISPSLIAAATVVVVRRLQGHMPHWPPALQVLTGYDLQPGSDLNVCIARVESLLSPRQ